MSNSGRSNHPGAYLDWAWWIGLLGLIVTIIFLVLLIIFIFDMIRSNSSSLKNDNNFNYMFVSRPMPFPTVFYVLF